MTRTAVLQSGAQLRPPAVDAAADGAELDPQCVRYFLIRQALDVAYDERGGVLVREGLERGLDVVCEVQVVEGLGGRGSGAAQPCGRLITEPLEPDPLPPARHVEEQVRRDAVQPPLESARGVAGQRPEDANEHLLGEILGIVAVAAQPVGQPVYPRRVITDHLIPARWYPRSGWLQRQIGRAHV